jgi:hypothetical protein
MNRTPNISVSLGYIFIKLFLLRVCLRNTGIRNISTAQLCKALDPIKPINKYANKGGRTCGSCWVGSSPPLPRGHQINNENLFLTITRCFVFFLIP